MKQQVLWLLVFLFASVVNVTAQVVYPEGTITDSSTVDSSALMRVKPVNVATDIIVLHTGEKLYVDVKKIQLNDLYYTFPKHQEILEMDKRLVKKVYYKSGKIETLSQADEDIPDVGDYRKVKVTRDKKDVEKFLEVGRFDAKAEGSRRRNTSLRSLERSAEIILRRKAALLNAHIVLVIDQQSSMAFGEVPSTTLTGVAYAHPANIDKDTLRQ
ncbi:MAG: hypothetical protein ACQESW_05635 [Bacteroidota bacterium]